MATLTEIQARIAARFDQSGTNISASSTEWTRRLILINAAAEKWDRLLRGAWLALKTSASLSTVAAQSYVDLSSGFKTGRLIVPDNGCIEIGNIQYPLLSTRDAISQLPTTNFCWITGNDEVGYRLNISPTPSAVVSFTIHYYTSNLALDASDVGKAALTTGTDVTLCPDPDYLVFEALAELYDVDNDVAQATRYAGKATAAKDEMLKLEVFGQGGQVLTIRDRSDNEGYEPIGGDEL